MYGYMGLITAGVRIGSNAEAEKEVMGLLQMMEIEGEEMMDRMEREDTRRQYPDSRTVNSPLPSTTLNSRPFDHSDVHHVQNGYAYAGLPSSPIYARRLLAVALEAYISIIIIYRISLSQHLWTNFRP